MLVNADDLRRLGSATAGVTDTDVYTVPTNSAATVWRMEICNTDAVARTFTVKLNGVELYFAAPLTAPGTVSYDGPQTLHAGEKIQVSADAAGKVKIYVTGKQFPFRG